MPFKTSPEPFVNQSESQNQDEKHGCEKARYPDCAERGDPRIEKDHLDIENDKEDSNPVVVHRKTLARLLERDIAAFEGGFFLFLIFAYPQPTR